MPASKLEGNCLRVRDPNFAGGRAGGLIVFGYSRQIISTKLRPRPARVTFVVICLSFQGGKSSSAVVGGLDLYNYGLARSIRAKPVNAQSSVITELAAPFSLLTYKGQRSRRSP